eukprot:gene7613-768_t
MSLVAGESRNRHVYRPLSPASPAVTHGYSFETFSECHDQVVTGCYRLASTELGHPLNWGAGAWVSVSRDRERLSAGQSDSFETNRALPLSVKVVVTGERETRGTSHPHTEAIGPGREKVQLQSPCTDPRV